MSHFTPICLGSLVHVRFNGRSAQQRRIADCTWSPHRPVPRSRVSITFFLFGHCTLLILPRFKLLFGERHIQCCQCPWRSSRSSLRHLIIWINGLPMDWIPHRWLPANLNLTWIESHIGHHSLYVMKECVAWIGLSQVGIIARRVHSQRWCLVVWAGHPSFWEDSSCHSLTRYRIELMWLMWEQRSWLAVHDFSIPCSTWWNHHVEEEFAVYIKKMATLDYPLTLLQLCSEIVQMTQKN